MKEDKLRRLTVVPILIAALFLSCKGGKAPVLTHRVVPVKMTPVEREEVVLPIHTSGILHSSAEVPLSFKIGGIVDQIMIREGEQVQKGRILASLKLDEIAAQVNQARTGFEKAERDFARAERLYADSVITQEQLQNAESGLAIAKSNLDIAEFNFSHARITAPSEGRILKKLAEEGQLVGEGTPILLFGSQAQAWRVKAGVADRDVVRIFPDDSVSVRFDAYPEIQFPARVEEISGAPDPSNGLFEIGIDLDPNPKTLYSGFVASLDIFPTKSTTMWVIPFGALTDVSGSEGTIYRITADSMAVRVPVQVAAITDDAAMILDGLKGVSSIVTEGAAYLSENTKVKVIQK